MYTCYCADGNQKSTDDCKNCTPLCGTPATTCVLDAGTATTTVVGLSVGVFLAILIVALVLWVFLIWFSIHVMRKCHGQPGWLNPIVITLLVLYFLMGWVPGLGFLFFIALLIILIVFNNKCVASKKK